MTGLTDSGNFDAFAAPVVTTWTSATSTSTSVIVTSAGLDTIALTISTGAGVTGGVISFNIFDGTNYIPIKCPNVSNYTTASSVTLTSSSTTGFTVPCAGYPSFQFVLTSAITGAGNVTITTIASSAPDTSIVAAGIDPASTSPPVGSGGLNIGQASVGTSGALIIAARAGAGPNGAGVSGTGRSAVFIANVGASTIYIGTSTGVTTSTGYPIPTGQSVKIYTTAAIYGVSGSASQTAAYMEVY
jgi:hypothetical protein